MAAARAEEAGHLHAATASRRQIASSPHLPPMCAWEGSSSPRVLPASCPSCRGHGAGGGRSEGELGGAHRVPTVLLPQQGTPLQSPCSPGRSARGVNVMGERKDVVLHGTLSLPEPEPRRASSSRWSWLWCSAPGRFPSTKPLLTEHRRARAAARAHPGDVLTGYIWLTPGLMSSGGLGG